MSVELSVELPAELPVELSAELSPALRIGDHDALRARWRAASLAASWCFPGDWWCPATEAVIEAFAEQRDPSAAVAELGRQRARCAVTLGEALDDLSALAHAVGQAEAPAALVRQLALGWADETTAAQIAAGCTDPLTGLATPAYLRTRLGEIYADASRAGADPGERFALVVADARVGARVGARSGGAESLLSSLDASGGLIALRELLGAVFSGGETIAATGPATAVVLVSRDEALLVRQRTLRDLIDLHGAPGRRTWIERLPSTLASARELIADLSR